MLTEQDRLASLLEDTGPGPFASDQEVFLGSIAISLKRIADAMWGNKGNAGLLWLIGEYTSREPR